MIDQLAGFVRSQLAAAKARGHPAISLIVLA
jgi:hypothetical protein